MADQEPSKKDNKELSTENKTKIKPKKAKRRWLYRLSYFLICLLLIIVAGFYYLLNTHHGLNQIIAGINKWSSYQIHVDKTKGKLSDRIVLDELSVVYDNREIFGAKRIVFDWDLSRILYKKITLQEFLVTDGLFDLLASEQSSNKQDEINNNTSKKGSFKDISSPISIDIQDISFLNFKITKGQSPLFLVNEFSTKISLEKDTLLINSLLFKSPQIDLSSSAKLQLKGDYPINWTNEVTFYHSKLGTENINLKLSGDIARLINVSIIGDGFALFNWDIAIDDLLDKFNINTELSVEKIDLFKLGHATKISGKANASGQLFNQRKIKSNIDLNYNSDSTGNIKVQLFGEILDDKIILDPSNIYLLDNQQSLGFLASLDLIDKSFDASFNSNKLGWPQGDGVAKVEINGLNINTLGTIDNYKLDANSSITIDNIPEAKVEINLLGDKNGLSKIDLQADISQGKLNGSGDFIWAGEPVFNIDISGGGIQESGNLPFIDGLVFKANGSVKTFDTLLKAKVSSQKIPSTIIKTTANINIDNESNIKGVIDTLDGSINFNGLMSIKPNFDLKADLEIGSLALQELSDQLHSDLYSKLRIELIKKELQTIANLYLDDLSGELLHQSIKGNGSIHYIDDQLSINSLSLDFAKNKISANGIMDKNLGINLEVSAKYLDAFLPNATGQFKANGNIKGSIKNPTIDLDVMANQVKYKNYQLDSLSLKYYLNMLDESIKLNLDAKQLAAAGQKIKRISTIIDGSFSDHKINFDLIQDNVGLNLQADGELKLEQKSWQGYINQLNISSPHKSVGTWKLKEKTNIAIFTDGLQANDFCLEQRQTKLCIDGDTKNPDGLSIKLDDFNTKKLRKLMPKSVFMDTSMNLAGNVKLIDGNRELKLNILGNGGKLNLVMSTGALHSEINKLSADLLLTNNKLYSQLNLDFVDLVKADIEYEMPDITQKKIVANIGLSADKLDFISDLFPQVDDIKGRINGKLTLSGQIDENIAVTGDVGILDTSFQIPEFGTKIFDTSLKIFAKDDNKLGFSGGLSSPEGGKITISGEIDPATSHGEIDILGDNFLLANSEKIRAKISPKIKVNLADIIKLRGSVLIPEAMIVPESNGEKKITTSEDIILPIKDKKTSENKLLDMEVAIDLGDDVRVASADIETRLLGGITIIAKPKQVLRASGVVQVETGELRVYGQLLNIERGRVIFGEGPISDPALDIRTTREFDDESITVGADVLGRVSAPEVSLFSTPSMSDSSILSYLLFGKPPDSESYGVTTLLKTGGLVGANSVARNLKHSMGLDVLDVSFTGLEAGKNITNKFYVGVRSNFFEAINQFLLEYKINSKFRLEGVVGSEDDSYADFIYTREKD